MCAYGRSQGSGSNRGQHWSFVFALIESSSRRCWLSESSRAPCAASTPPLVTHCLIDRSVVVQSLALMPPLPGSARQQGFREFRILHKPTTPAFCERGAASGSGCVAIDQTRRRAAVMPSSSKATVSSHIVAGSGTAPTARDIGGTGLFGTVGRASDAIDQVPERSNKPVESMNERPTALGGSGSNMSPEPPLMPFWIWNPKRWLLPAVRIASIGMVMLWTGCTPATKV